MKIAIFDTQDFDRTSLEKANGGKHELRFFNAKLNPETALLAKGSDVACCSAHDKVDAPSLCVLQLLGIRLVTLRSAGFNQIDLKEAKILGLTVTRVPAYSPHAIAEHAVALLLAENRKVPRAYARVRDLNFSFHGLMGFDLFGKTVGIVGTGKIGRAFGNIMKGFGCHILAFDKTPNTAWATSVGAEYVSKERLLRESNVISLHLPLNPESKHIIDAAAFAMMKADAYLINTGRGALIDTKALVTALKRHKIGAACLDVYEEEENVFQTDRSETGINDDTLARLLTFPNVLITAHQAFFTTEAVQQIAETTILNVTKFAEKQNLGASLVEL